jgi:hypothetical protein
MQIGDAIRVDDLELPAGVATDMDGETVVVVAQGMQATEAAAEPEGEAAGGGAPGQGAAEQSGAEPPASPEPGGGSA